MPTSQSLLGQVSLPQSEEHTASAPTSFISLTPFSSTPKPNFPSSYQSPVYHIPMAQINMNILRPVFSSVKNDDRMRLSTVSRLSPLTSI